MTPTPPALPEKKQASMALAVQCLFVCDRRMDPGSTYLEVPEDHVADPQQPYRTHTYYEVPDTFPPTMVSTAQICALADELLWTRGHDKAGCGGVCNTNTATGIQYAERFVPNETHSYVLATSVDLYTRLQMAAHSQVVAVEALRLLR